MPRDIPGFYFDERRGKYFRIQPDHLAPGGSRYSRKAVKEETEQQKKSREKARHDRWLASWAFVRKPSLSPIDRYLLTRGVGGYRPGAHPSVASIWNQGLTHAAGIVLPSSREKKRYRLGKPADNESDCYESIQSLAWNPAMKQLMVALRNGIYPHFYSPERRTFVSGLITSYNLDHLRVPCPATKLSLYKPISAKIVTTAPSYMSHFTDSSLVLLVKYNSCSVVDLARFSSLASSDLSSLPRRLESDFVRLYPTPDQNSTFLVHHAKPRPSAVERLEVAIGTESGMFLASERGAYLLSPRSDDVMFVDWLDRNVTIGGSRNGTIKLYDIRVDGSVASWERQGGTIHVEAIDASRILIAGYSNQMHLYDLRFQKPPHMAERREADFDVKPYLHYPGFDSPGNQIPITVSKTHGLVATGGPKGIVQLFDLWHGNKIEASKKWEKGMYENGKQVNSICFVDEMVQTKHGASGPTLLIGRSKTVEQWSWVDDLREEKDQVIIEKGVGNGMKTTTRTKIQG